MYISSGRDGWANICDHFCFLCDFLSISWRRPVGFCIWEGWARSVFFHLEIYKYKFLPCKQILFDRLLLACLFSPSSLLLLCANAMDFCLLRQLDFHGEVSVVWSEQCGPFKGRDKYVFPSEEVELLVVSLLAMAHPKKWFRSVSMTLENSQRISIVLGILGTK